MGDEMKAESATSLSLCACVLTVGQFAKSPKFTNKF